MKQRVEYYLVAKTIGKNKKEVWSKKLHELEIRLPEVEYTMPNYLNASNLKKDVSVIFIATIKDKRFVSVVFPEEGEPYVDFIPPKKEVKK